MPLYISAPPRHPLTRFLLALVGLVALVASFMLGLIALAVVAGIGLIAGLFLWLRMAWIARKLRREGLGDAATDAFDQRPKADAIEAEYTVIRTHRDS